MCSLSWKLMNKSNKLVFLPGHVTLDAMDLTPRVDHSYSFFKKLISFQIKLNSFISISLYKTNLESLQTFKMLGRIKTALKELKCVLFIKNRKR